AGGGIGASGALTVDSYSLIQFNTVIGAGVGSGDGGGIAIAGGTATIDSSDILDNQALGGYDAATNTYSPLGPGAGYGGGIAVISGTVTLTNDAIDSNSPGSYFRIAFPRLHHPGFCARIPTP